MAKLYGEDDANPQGLAGRRIAILGYGSQGRAQALNLCDARYEVVVGLRRGGKSWAQAEEDGWEPTDPPQAVRSSEVVAMLVPDMAQPSLYREAVASNLKKGAMLLFSHGFNIHYRQIHPPADVDVTMVAPKGPGNLVRRQYEQGQGVPCLLAVHQDSSGHAFERALAYAHGLGGTRAGVLETTFAEERKPKSPGVK